MHHSFRASVLATLRQRNWAGGMFSTAKSIPSAAGSSTTTFPMWTDMKTSRQLILGNMKDKSKYSRVDSPAKDSLLLASERERRMTATYGRRCIEQSPKSSPLMFLARTLLESSQWYHPTMSLRWRAKPLYSMRVRRFLRAGQPTSPRTSEETLSEKDMPSKYFYYQLVPSVRPTAETECGFSQSGLAETQGGGDSEKSMFSILPTPTASEFQHRRRVEELKEKGANSIYQRINGALRPNGLADFLQFILPTPTSRDWKGAEACEYKRQRGEKTDIRAYSLPGQFLSQPQDGKVFQQLNPLFVEEMMGFPRNWILTPFLSQDGGQSH